MCDVYASDVVAALIDLSLREDLGEAGDRTVDAVVPAGQTLHGVVVAKAPGVLCGLPLFARVFAAVAAGWGGGQVCVEEQAADGTVVAAGQAVLRCRGDARTMLMSERTALNFTQRLSGTATVAAAYAAMVVGTPAAVYDTRKTTPGMRTLQKHAVVCGGCRNHRMGLHDQILIKENHIALMGGSGGPAEAVRRARAAATGVRIQVEIERLDDLPGVIAAGADMVLLDNMDLDQLREAVRIRGDAPVELEASGGITDERLPVVAATGVDRISVGALTHSVRSLDLSLRCEAEA
ncbi:MAG: carboxylating nicotinate-nucleotide diphosphorylase [Planctomycetota bacterium]